MNRTIWLTIGCVLGLLVAVVARVLDSNLAVTIAGTFLGLLGIWITVFTYYSDLSKKVTFLVEKDYKGILKKDQALQVIDLYLIW